MKSLTPISTTNTRRFRISLAALLVILAMTAIGAGLVRELYLRGSSQATAPASSVDIYAPLDQHERHPAGFPSTIYAPLDQHERHPNGLLQNVYAPLDQHERHAAGFPNLNTRR